MVAADHAKWVSFGECRVRAIHGWNNQAADVYIQLIEASKGTVAVGTVQPANATVPKYKALLAQAGNGFAYDLDVNFSELIVAASTTETALTIVGAAGGLDLTIEVDGQYLVDMFPTLTVVGDLTNDVTTLQVWPDGSPKTLMRIDARQGADGVLPLVGYAVDTPAATSRPLFAFTVSGSTVAAPTSINFGRGQAFMDKTASTQAVHTGLTLQAQNGIAAIANPGLNMKIRAMYI